MNTRCTHRHKYRQPFGASNLVRDQSVTGYTAIQRTSSANNRRRRRRSRSNKKSYSVSYRYTHTLTHTAEDTTKVGKIARHFKVVYFEASALIFATGCASHFSLPHRLPPSMPRVLSSCPNWRCCCLCAYKTRQLSTFPGTKSAQRGKKMDRQQGVCTSSRERQRGAQGVGVLRVEQEVPPHSTSQSHIWPGLVSEEQRNKPVSLVLRRVLCTSSRSLSFSLSLSVSCSLALCVIPRNH